MEFLNEHLLPGQIGHFSVVLSFVAAILSMTAYVFATQKRTIAEGASWLRLGRASFILHGAATFTVIGSLFFILINRFYEYQLAQANVADDLPNQYIFSAFWKEQQGSFLLWMFWHVVLGLILIWKEKKFEAPVLAVIAGVEALIGSMILGLYTPIGKIGATPFALLRDVIDAPIFKQADYVSKLSGQGLNPLLQNYWMTIHPPTLFLGFASTVVPFAFAIAALWTGDAKHFLKRAMPWALFSSAILGLGVLMGGAWAYEALTFQGYWAWDPVENMSLVPWLLLVAGVHTHLVARATGYSVRSTLLFYLFSFAMIGYSTFLTRSGILGDTSAHAFTEMGLGPQLVIFIVVALGTGLAFYFFNVKKIDQPTVEEATASREFWMFLGSLVLLFSSILITGATSLPVWNRIVQFFQPDYVGAVLKDQAEHHNRYQLWIAVLMGLFSGIGQFMRFNEKNWSGWRAKAFRHLGGSALVAGAATAASAFFIKTTAWNQVLMLFAGWMAIFSNLDYLVFILKNNLKLAGSVVSHFGFGVLILGILLTGLNRYHISSNRFVMDGLIEGFTEEDYGKNVSLLKESPLPIKGYEVVYESDTLVRQTRFFKTTYRKRDEKGQFTGEKFSLEPNVMYDRSFTKVAASNPATKHFFDRDIFTNIAALPPSQIDAEAAKAAEDSLVYSKYKARVGDTVFTKKNFFVVRGLEKQPKTAEFEARKGDLAIGLRLDFGTADTSRLWPALPIVAFSREGMASVPTQINALGVKMRLTESVADNVFDLRNQLKFSDLKMKVGGSAEFNGLKINLLGIEKNIKHPFYFAEPNDIAVAMNLEIEEKTGRKFTLAPVYLIRENRPMPLKDEDLASGLHVFFANVDPATEEMTVRVAQAPAEMREIEIELAENAKRNDFLVLEAVVIPGINLVWLGSLLMLFGFVIALFRRLKER